MMRMLLSHAVVRRTTAVTATSLRPFAAGRITVKGPSKTAAAPTKLEKRKESLLIKTNLEEHFAYLKSQRLDPNSPPPTIPNELGLVQRDLTDEMVDVGSMFDARLHLPNAPRQWLGYEESTPLSKELISVMAVRGQPVTVADFMRQALTHELYGYYTNPTKMEDDDDWDGDDKEDDDDDDDWDVPTPANTTPDNFIIGRQGDFVTAPEVSQVFGECLAVWFVTQFKEDITSKAQGAQLVEVGPGKGTLIQDVLRSCCTLSDKMQSSIREVHLVEASPAMRQEQQRKLEALVLPDKNIRIVFDIGDSTTDDSAGADGEKKEGSEKAPVAPANENEQIITVRWHATFNNFALATEGNGLATYVVCQEFIDALPVHVFEKTEEGWRERMIDVAIQEDEEELAEAKKKEEADQKQAEAEAADDKKKSKKEEKKTRLRVVVSPGVSPACKTLLNVDETTGQMENDNSPVGAVCEVCPEGILLVQDIAKLIQERSGAALIVDYGNAEGATDSLRGFSRHEQVHFLSRPGQVDVTADVDFAALVHAVNRHNNTTDAATAFGPVTQGDFLASMGIVERVVSLIEDDATTDEEAEDLYAALERLILPEQMGSRYKVMAIGRKKDGIFAPPGFKG